MAKIQMTIEELQHLLDQQKRITIEQCLGHSYYYNKESTLSQIKPLPIDEEKFKEQGMNAAYPNDFQVLKKYISNP